VSCGFGDGLGYDWAALSACAAFCLIMIVSSSSAGKFSRVAQSARHETSRRIAWKLPLQCAACMGRGRGPKGREGGRAGRAVAGRAGGIALRCNVKSTCKRCH